MEIFGFEIKKSKEKEVINVFDIDSNTPVIQENGMVSYSYDFGVVPTAEVDLIKTYRTMAASADIDLAISEIKNEIFINDVPGKKAISLSLSHESKNISKALFKKIEAEYDELYSILDFDRQCFDYFDSWYVDGKLYLHKILDGTNTKKGIKKIVKIDPLKIKKITEYPKADSNGIFDLNKVKEYFIYTNNPATPVRSITTTTKGLRINTDSICYIDSGLYNRTESSVMGFLWKAINPYNNLKLMEDSLIIYRVVRAPERRVIYIDVGNLPKVKAEQYIKDLMTRFKNKLTYDAKTGNLSDKRNVMSMVEDYWLPRRDGGKGTEITTLQGGDSTGVITDVEYFRSKLFQSLNVPQSRFAENANPFMFGKGVEISRDEYRFKKFIDRLRSSFVMMFEDLLRTQLVLKNVIVADDWNDIRRELMWEFAEDNNFVEFKESELINNRINTLITVDPLVGRYVTKEWALKNIMRFTDKEIAELDKETVDVVPDGADQGDAPEQDDGGAQPQEQII